MGRLRSGLLALMAGMMLSGCADGSSSSALPGSRGTDQDIHAVFSTGDDNRSPIKSWLFGD
jgi:hypothetical protein